MVDNNLQKVLSNIGNMRISVEYDIDRECKGGVCNSLMHTFKESTIDSNQI